MRFRVIILSLLVISIFAFSLSQGEVSILKYQLQMPNVSGNAFGLRMVGTLQYGAFGLVWKYENKSCMFTGQVLTFNSVFQKWLETGVFEWSNVYFDIFLLLRF